jgi:hypothetical protein
MIALGSKCLVFQGGNGEGVPLSADMISIELSGEAAQLLDQQHVDNAAEAVFHYFKHDLKRHTVTMAEFSEALEKALKALTKESSPAQTAGPTVESDLAELARKCGTGCELVFFPRLRTELRDLLKGSPQTLQFSGLKGCVKALTGSRRWNPECRSLKDQIISFLRGCLRAEHSQRELSLVVK